MEKSCIFCKIANKELGELIYEDEQIVAFNDLHPQAPVHILIIPRKHINTIDDATPNEKLMLGHMLHTAKQLANEKSIAQGGYRLIINCNEEGGQTVFHLHLHLLGGRSMQWPPG